MWHAPVADDVEASLSAGYNLLAEARANKIGTIPPKAIVQLRIGPFDYVELTEILDCVQCVFRTDDGCFGIGYIEPNKPQIPVIHFLCQGRNADWTRN